MVAGNDNRELAAKVVELLYEKIITGEFKPQRAMTAEHLDRINAQREKFRQQFRNTHTSLYARHMNREQLQALLDFHDSDMGRSIKQAQQAIYRELSERHENGRPKDNVRNLDDDCGNEALAAKVVDRLHRELFSRQFKRAETIPQEQAEKIIAERQTFLDWYRHALVALYGKHLTAAQLQALLAFHDSDMGRSIEAARERLHEELHRLQERRDEEQDGNQPEPGGAVIQALTKTSDFFNPDDDIKM